MTVTVNTDNGQFPVPGGVDFTVDWESGADMPGLAVLNKAENDPTAHPVAYFAPGHWTAVVTT